MKQIKQMVFVIAIDFHIFNFTALSVVGVLHTPFSLWPCEIKYLKTYIILAVAEWILPPGAMWCGQKMNRDS
ncbi:MAG: hypothetical protein C4B58_08280 [Deltaproteobacteria bacterium]|nr:MAG: hypothetical protein C4B58_08280 [Deltaproteobacteria bacterium]